MGKQTLTIAAVGDLHCAKSSHGRFQPLFSQLAERADVILLCGDLTDYGTHEEARVLAAELAPAARVPRLAVLGNHDFESGHQEEVVKILTHAGVTVLDGDAVEIEGVGFAGAKGFCGGFGTRMLSPWGEPLMKQFVADAVSEAMKLESGLAKLRTATRIAVLHYAPIAETVEGEPAEIYPWLGSSRLEEPLDRYAVSFAVHGHAHRGTPEGKTRGGVPVYNVAMPLLRRTQPDGLPVRMLTVPVVGRETAPATPGTG